MFMIAWMAKCILWTHICSYPCLPCDRCHTWDVKRVTSVVRVWDNWCRLFESSDRHTDTTGIFVYMIDGIADSISPLALDTWSSSWSCGHVFLVSELWTCYTPQIYTGKMNKSNHWNTFFHTGISYAVFFQDHREIVLYIWINLSVTLTV
jgi:hypothetical protein